MTEPTWQRRAWMRLYEKYITVLRTAIMLEDKKAVEQSGWNAKAAYCYQRARSAECGNYVDFKCEHFPNIPPLSDEQAKNFQRIVVMAGVMK